MESFPSDIWTVLTRFLCKEDLLSLALTCRHLGVVLTKIVRHRNDQCAVRSKQRLLDAFVPPEEAVKGRRRRFSGPSDPTHYFDMLEGIDFTYKDRDRGLCRVVRFLRAGTRRYGATVNQKLYGTFMETLCGSWLIDVSLSHNVVSMWDGSSWGSVYSKVESFQIRINKEDGVPICIFSINPNKYRYTLRQVPQLLEEPFAISKEWEEAKERAKERENADHNNLSKWANFDLIKEGL